MAPSDQIDGRIEGNKIVLVDVVDRIDTSIVAKTITAVRNHVHLYGFIVVV
jgi:hypothetical protein